MDRNGIAVAGSILVDEINAVRRYPSCGELAPILARSRSVGGCVPNVAIDLKKLRPDLPVWALGRIGDDSNGRFVKEQLQNQDVNVDFLVTDPEEATSFTQVISVIGGQRTFFTYPGASSRFARTDVPLRRLQPRLLHLGYFLLMERMDAGDGLALLTEASAQGIETSIDMISERSDRYSAVLPCLPLTAYLIINELEAGRLTGLEPTPGNLKRIATTLRSLGVRKKVILHFSAGAVCLSDDGFTQCASYQLPDGFIQGTTGAGDAFCAGALIGIYNNASDSALLSIATTAATAALRTPDATGGLDALPTLQRQFENLERTSLCL